MLSGALGHYVIVEHLGSGGMGDVYRVEDTRLGRQVALKTLRPELAGDEERLKRFRREAQLLAALDHPGIVTIFSVEQADGVHFITMQLIEGSMLNDLIPSGGLDVNTFFDIALPLADAVAAAHERSVIHRDLKPANIIRTPQGTVKVLDFGLAKLHERGHSESQEEVPTQPVTAENLVVGTLPYMSPEQIAARDVDERSDIFSLGVVLHEMATGVRPFEGTTSTALLSAILTGTPSAVSNLRPDLPAALSDTIRRCLEKDRQQRVQTARDVYLRLQDSRGAISSEARDRIESREVPTLPSIAVLPLSTLSSDREDEFLADGVSEEIINALGRIPGLKVAARTSSFSFKGKSDDLRQIGEKLGVRNILEGSVRRSGRRLRVTAQLVDVGSGYHLWSEKFDREMTDIFDIQDEISRNIVSKLTRTLITDSDPSLIHRGTDDVPAFQLYTKGVALLRTLNEADIHRAVTCFREAISRDPNYADAWTGMANAWVALEQYGFVEPQSLLDDARQAIDRALELNPTLAEAHASLGLLYSHQSVRNGRKAIAALEKAIELNPGYADAHDVLSWIHLVVGHPAQGLEAARRAVELDPLLPEALSNLALGYLVNGNAENAITEARRAKAIQPGYSTAVLYEAAALYLLGRYEEVIELTRELKVEWAPNGPEGLMALAEVGRGESARARQILHSIEQTPDLANAAFVRVALGEHEEALAQLEAVSQWDYWPSIAILGVYRELVAPLRRSVTYQKVIREVNDSWGMAVS